MWICYFTYLEYLVEKQHLHSKRFNKNCNELWGVGWREEEWEEGQDSDGTAGLT